MTVITADGEVVGFVLALADVSAACGACAVA